MCICADRHPKCAGQAKVSQLNVALGVDQQILGLEVSVQHTVNMTVGNACKQLVHVAL